MTRQLNNDNGLQTDSQERQHLTAPTKNWRFSASYDSFVVKQTLVLRMKFSGENRQLLVAKTLAATLTHRTKQTDNKQ